MRPEVKFDLRDIQEQVNPKGDMRTIKGVLFFTLSRPSATREKNAVGTELELKATQAHVSQYREAYKTFRELHPDYRCEWPELEVNVSAPVVAKAPEQVAVEVSEQVAE